MQTEYREFSMGSTESERLDQENNGAGHSIGAGIASGLIGFGIFLFILYCFGKPLVH